MSFAEAIVKHALKFAADKHAKKILSVKVLVGELLMINPEQLQFCFEIASKGTLLEGAKLVIEVEKADAVCISCGKKVDSSSWMCSCGGLVDVRGGRDFVLEKIVLEV